MLESSLSVQWVAKDPSFLHADSEGSNQTAVDLLICNFAERACHFVGYVMRWLKLPLFIDLQFKKQFRLSQLMKLRYLSHRRQAKAQASLRFRAVSPEPSLFAHMEY